MWDQCRHALEFFAGAVPGATAPIPFHRMQPNDTLVTDGHFCFTLPQELWLVYVTGGGSTTLSTEMADHDMHVQWFDPREGRFTNKPVTSATDGSGQLSLEAPDTQDWLAIVSVNAPESTARRDD